MPDVSPAIQTALTNAGFTRDTGNGDGHQTPFVRQRRLEDAPTAPVLTTCVWADPDSYTVIAFNSDLPTPDQPVHYGSVTLLPADDHDPAVVEVVARDVAVPAAILGAVRRTKIVAAALLRGELPEPVVVPDSERAARMEAVADAIAQRVENGDVQIVNVMGSADGLPSLNYTVGLPLLHHHPEIAILSLPHAAANTVLRAVVQRIADGLQLDDGHHLDDLATAPLRVVALPTDVANAVLAAAAAFLEQRGLETRALQLVWPDDQGRFPDQPGYDVPPHAQDLTTHTDALPQHTLDPTTRDAYRARVRPQDP